uniref:MARVEL domain-containing protein n=1 Tax=Trichuris muris TaxID=70415 RepID=A0A5S6R5C0_TRIMR
MAELLSQMNTRILKEPLGFIRVIEFPMVILAFATTAGYAASMLVQYSCFGEKEYSNEYHLDWSYPFDLPVYGLASNFCDPKSQTVYPFGEGAVSQSQFFVCTGILSFLYILGILCVYLFQLEKYETDNRWPVVDFLITVVLAIFWFIASCAWAAGVSTLKSITDPMTVKVKLISISVLCASKDHACAFPTEWNYASLNVSLIAGFACFFLFASNLWFIWKETEWFKSRQPPSASMAPSSMPQQSASYSGPR